MRGDGPRRESPAALPDGALWRHSRLTEVAEDEAARLLDVAAYADGLLDSDDRERVAEWLEGDPDAAGDVAAARALAGADRQLEPIPETVVGRASALVPPGNARPDNVVAFAPRRRWNTGLEGIARWGSLAAAVVVASWLGFSMGVDVSRSFGLPGRTGDDGALNELFDPSANVMRDLTDGAQT